MFEIFNGAKSVTVDGKKYDCDDTEILTKLKAASAAMFSGVDASCTASMVRYMLNASGEICAIDTMLNYNTGALGTREDTITGTNDALFVTTLSSAKYRQTYMVIGPKAAFTATSVVFFYPDPTKDDVDDEDNYETGIAKNLLTHGTVYNGYAYFTDPTVLKTGFLGIPVSFVRDKSIAESSKFSVVDEVYKVYDQDNDDILDCVRFITSSGSAEVMVKDSKKNCVKAVDNEDEELLASNMPVTGLKRGDVVAYTTDIKGYLSSVTLYLRIDGSENQLVQGVAPGSTWWASRTQRYGFVYEKYDDGMLVYFASTLAEVEEARKRIEGKDSAKPITADECELVSFTSASPAYYSWEADRDGDMVAKASSQGALKSYKDTGTDCSLIYMQQNYGAPMAIMILE